MIISGVQEESLYMNAIENIILKMAYLYQMQDDHLDIWGNPDMTGKIGISIAIGKSTWPKMRALQLASVEQKYLLKENYGKQNDESVDIVKRIFKSLNLENLFQNEKIKFISEIKLYIENLKRIKHSINTELLVKYLDILKSYLEFQ